MHDIALFAKHKCEEEITLHCSAFFLSNIGCGVRKIPKAQKKKRKQSYEENRLLLYGKYYP